MWISIKMGTGRAKCAMCEQTILQDQDQLTVEANRESARVHLDCVFGKKIHTG